MFQTEIGLTRHYFSQLCQYFHACRSVGITRRKPFEDSDCGECEAFEPCNDAGARFVSAGFIKIKDGVNTQ
jgi:hypothetical protein